MTFEVNLNVHVHDHADKEFLEMILAALGAFRAETRQAMSALDDKITALQAEVAKNTTVEKSALALIQGFSGRLDAAVQMALAAGATDAELKSITDLSTSLKANDDELAAAVTQNTPAAPPATP